MHLEQAIDYVGGNYGPSTGQLLNIICRSILHFAAVVACLVPMQLFCRSGELAGATLVISGALMNLYHFTNTLTWHNDDIANWPRGYGWCDIQLASAVPLETMVAASTCAILRNVAIQISSLRATTLTGSEKRRKNLAHALIIFPVPLLEGILYFFVIKMRYNISGIIGCQAIFQTNWVFVVFFLLPCPIFSLCAGYYAVITWWRYKQIDTESRESLWNSSNPGARARNARARRKLYFMTLTILTPWLPMQLVFLYNNISAGMPWSEPFDLPSVHSDGWNQIDYAPISTVPWIHLYGTYAYAFEVLIVFLYFGLTKDAHDLYREYLRTLGLGKIFPKLNEEYFPSEQPPSSLSSMWSRAKRAPTFASSTQASQNSSGRSSNKTSISARQVNEVDDVQLLNIRLNSLDLEAARSTTDAARSSEQMPRLPIRNPWVFRTTAAPQFNMSTIFGGDKGRAASKSSSQGSLKPVIHPLHTTQAPSAMGKYRPGPSSSGAHGAGWNPAQRDGRVHTRVWAVDPYGTSAVAGESSGDKEMDEGIVRIERHISSSSEVSPPRPAYR
ncbi:hypothetical protein INS49_006151 [Diaporthe citri]|uniref:uncharacterized protein n=1 Tax=Diaporthe citri TaxID=83186 RepID=UPI001C7EC83B|nr:uncharacterized protein INS49_006151 [Diaporthe citri]KAG6364549.1 hypothetical protein INS49_006151 [Diaporthe citri]